MAHNETMPINKNAFEKASAKDEDENETEK